MSCNAELNHFLSLSSSAPEHRKAGLEEGSVADSQDNLGVSPATSHLLTSESSLFPEYLLPSPENGIMCTLSTSQVLWQPDRLGLLRVFEK